MIKQFLFTISLLCISYTYSQLPQALQKYYDYTNKAEHAIITNDKKNASDYYQKAFEIKKQPFFDDIYNSFIVNIEIENNERAKQNYKRLKCLGYDFPIKGYDFFIKFSKNNKDFIDTADCIKEQGKFNYKLRKTLDSLAKSDQLYGRFTSLDFEASSKKPDKEFIKKLNKNDSTNAIKLKEVIGKNGFPTEYEVGVYSQKDAFSPDYFLVILHQQKKGKDKDVDFIPLLYKAVLEGKLRNRNFVDAIEHAMIKKDYNFPLIGLNGEYYISKSIYLENRDEAEKKEIDRIEDNRKKIGLPSLSETTLSRLFKVNRSSLYRFEPTSYIQYFTESSGDNLVKKITDNTVKLNFEDYSKYLNDKDNNGK